MKFYTIEKIYENPGKICFVEKWMVCVLDEWKSEAFDFVL